MLATPLPHRCKDLSKGPTRGGGGGWLVTAQAVGTVRTASYHSPLPTPLSGSADQRLERHVAVCLQRNRLVSQRRIQDHLPHEPVAHRPLRQERARPGAQTGPLEIGRASCRERV